MRSISPHLLHPGMIVAASVYPPGDESGLPLIAPGVVITDALKQRLIKSTVRSMLIDDEYSRDILPDPAISDRARREARLSISSTFSQVSQGIGEGTGTSLSPRQVEKISSSMTAIMTELALRKNLMTGLSDLSRFGGDRVQRAVNVCVVGITIGQRYLERWGWHDFKGNPRHDQFQDRVKKLGIGLMLMDIGMLNVPPHAWDQELHTLSQDEQYAVRQHPTSGVDLLRDAAGDISPLTTIAIAQHHERIDGSGYPAGVEGGEIHEHGLIAGVADTYLTLTEPGQGDRPPQMAPHEAYAHILGEAGHSFDVRVVKAFRETVAPHGPGATLELSDGTSCIVVAHSTYPIRPVVRVTHNASGEPIDPAEIDLSAQNEIYVAKALEGLPGDAFFT